MSEHEAAQEDQPKKVKKAADHELAALKKIGAILSNLSDDAKRRVLGYLADRAV